MMVWNFALFYYYVVKLDLLLIFSAYLSKAGIIDRIFVFPLDECSGLAIVACIVAVATLISTL